MPKYKLDDKGILTITSESDGGIFSVSETVQKISSILLIISVVASIAIYLFFYLDAPKTNVAFNYIIYRLSDFTFISEFRNSLENLDFGFGLGEVYKRLEDIPGYIIESFEEVENRAMGLQQEICYRIDVFRHVWR